MFPVCHYISETYICVRRRKNTLQTKIGVEIAWDNVDSVNECVDLGTRISFPPQILQGGGWGGGDHNQLGKGERIIERTPQSLIITSFIIINQ